METQRFRLAEGWLAYDDQGKVPALSIMGTRDPHFKGPERGAGDRGTRLQAPVVLIEGPGTLPLLRCQKRDNRT
ncbi:hypothetical protein [Thermogemmatispora tikiterensis]|uniref:Uncharacterized protein n=1 Tax=Thermogemmatispora tikiterensis TaxID=1825093 RepID=A0A328VFZ2_9CHLR|nr:hypothetical protein [Thermogemmatispora tikiterensis]RAQ94224.1 hypothetical protein A4R35_01690 [Thermogemmatispora tikiterensis]